VHTGSTHRRRALRVNRRHLSDDVRQRTAVRVAKSVTNTPLPLAGPEVETTKPMEAELGGSSEPALVQTRRDEGQDKAQDRPGTRPNLQQLADRVYQLMRQDLHLERERRGW
jgi:hypothetical protein